MRVRTKDCFKCQEPNEVMYRCRYQELKDWVFLCGKCLQQVKAEFENTYQYGGTWKAKKKRGGARATGGVWDMVYVALHRSDF